MIQWAYEIQFVFALFFTLAIEVPVLCSVIRLWLKEPGASFPFLRILTVGIFATLATLPYVWFVLPFFFRTYLPYILISESFAVIAETVLYMCCLRLKPSHALGISMLCNAASFFGGEILKFFL